MLKRIKNLFSKSLEESTSDDMPEVEDCDLKLLRLQEDQVPKSWEKIDAYPPQAKSLSADPISGVLYKNKATILQIKESLGLTDELFGQLLMPVIRNLADFLHLLPASENHHHRGSGGALKHALEVGFWSARSSEDVIFCVNGNPVERRKREPLWRIATCISGMLHDGGKPIADLQVSDENGDIWKPLEKGLYSWLKEERREKYFISWMEGRHKRHERFTQRAFDFIVPNSVITEFMSNDPKIMEAVYDAICGVGTTDHISRIILNADQQSVKRDLAIDHENSSGSDFNFGLPIHRYIFSAIRKQISTNSWSVNEVGAKIWHTNKGTFLIWKPALTEVIDIIKDESSINIGNNPDDIADQLIQLGLAEPRHLSNQDQDESYYYYWIIMPKLLADSSGPAVKLTALKLDDPLRIFTSELPVEVECTLWEEDSETGELVESPEPVEDPMLTVNTNTGEIIGNVSAIPEESTATATATATMPMPDLGFGTTTKAPEMPKPVEPKEPTSHKEKSTKSASVPAPVLPTANTTELSIAKPEHSGKSVAPEKSSKKSEEQPADQSPQDALKQLNSQLGNVMPSFMSVSTEQSNTNKAKPEVAEAPKQTTSPKKPPASNKADAPMPKFPELQKEVAKEPAKPIQKQVKAEKPKETKKAKPNTQNQVQSSVPTPQTNLKANVQTSTENKPTQSVEFSHAKKAEGPKLVTTAHSLKIKEQKEERKKQQVQTPKQAKQSLRHKLHNYKEAGQQCYTLIENVLEKEGILGEQWFLFENKVCFLYPVAFEQFGEPVKVLKAWGESGLAIKNAQRPTLNVHTYCDVTCAVINPETSEAVIEAIHTCEKDIDPFKVKPSDNPRALKYQSPSKKGKSGTNRPKMSLSDKAKNAAKTKAKSPSVSDLGHTSKGQKSKTQNSSTPKETTIETLNTSSVDEVVTNLFAQIDEGQGPWLDGFKRISDNEIEIFESTIDKAIKSCGISKTKIKTKIRMYTKTNGICVSRQANKMIFTYEGN